MFLRGDSLQVLENFADNTFDLIVTDPPYGISFMGKDWDKALPSIDIWKECFRVLKEGKLAFIMCSPRQDVLSRMIINLEDAGFRTNYTSIYWTYASGFPKAANVSKLIDKKLGAKSEIIGIKDNRPHRFKQWKENDGTERKTFTSNHIKPATDEAKKMEGAYVGFQPKPAVEVILVVSKGKTLTWLDDCRIPYQNNEKTCPTCLGKGNTDKIYQCQRCKGSGIINDDKWENMPKGWTMENSNIGWRREAHLKYNKLRESNQKGRFPANLLVSDDVLNDGKITKSSKDLNRFKTFRYRDWSQEHGYDQIKKPTHPVQVGGYDEGSYSRYFSLDAWSENKTFPFIITPKASKSEKNKGCEDLPLNIKQSMGDYGDQSNYECSDGSNRVGNKGESKQQNNHPTVKPLKLFSYLITMGSREGDLVLDPFIGSGTTYLASVNLHRECIGIELNPEYLQIAKARVKPLLQQTKLEG